MSDRNRIRAERDQFVYDLHDTAVSVRAMALTMRGVGERLRGAGHKDSARDALTSQVGLLNLEAELLSLAERALEVVKPSPDLRLVSSRECAHGDKQE